MNAPQDNNWLRYPAFYNATSNMTLFNDVWRVVTMFQNIDAVSGTAHHKFQSSTTVIMVAL
jgi:hypothetical protein